MRQLRPFHQGCSSKCTKARGGCKRRRELSWRQLEQRAGRHDSRASASAPTAAADGRKVVGGGRGTSCGTCEAVRAPQGRNLTALRPAGGAGSRKNLLRTMPWYPCNSINTAIREISPSAGDWHIASFSGHYIRCATAKGRSLTRKGWDDPIGKPIGRGAQVRYGGQPISFKLDAFVSYGSSDPITLARIAIRYSGVPPLTPPKRHLHTLDSRVHECHAPISQLRSAGRFVQSAKKR